MAKTVKRFSAILLAVMMLVAMVPTAFAATDYSFTLQNNKPGYSYAVYKVADYNETTGAYTAVAGVDEAVAAEVAKSTGSSVALLNALNAATNTGTAMESFTSTSTATTKTYSDLTGGIYYVKNTGVPVATAESTKNNVIVLDASKKTATVDLSMKTKDGSDPKVKKTFGDGSIEQKSVSFDEDIEFVLTADVTGTAQNKLESFVINDKMDSNLDASKVTIKSVKLGTTDLKYTYTTENIDDNTFSIVIDRTELAKDSFYVAGGQVVVTYTTKLVPGAAVKTLINNEDSLKYKYENESDPKVVPGTDVQVITYGVKVTKVDSETKNPITDGVATFGLYRDAACTDKIEEANTVNGVATFNARLKVGTYYVKELTAPEGYNLNSSVQTVTINGNDGYAAITVEDTKTRVPETGGVGTMMFTVGGISLILAAGVLFVIVMRKRNAK